MQELSEEEKINIATSVDHLLRKQNFLRTYTGVQLNNLKAAMIEFFESLTRAQKDLQIYEATLEDKEKLFAQAQRQATINADESVTIPVHENNLESFFEKAISKSVLNNIANTHDLVFHAQNKAAGLAKSLESTQEKIAAHQAKVAKIPEIREEYEQDIQILDKLIQDDTASEYDIATAEFRRIAAYNELDNLNDFEQNHAQLLDELQQKLKNTKQSEDTAQQTAQILISISAKQDDIFRIQAKQEAITFQFDCLSKKINSAKNKLNNNLAQKAQAAISKNIHDFETARSQLQTQIADLHTQEQDLTNEIQNLIEKLKKLSPTQDPKLSAHHPVNYAQRLEKMGPLVAPANDTLQRAHIPQYNFGKQKLKPTKNAKSAISSIKPNRPNPKKPNLSV